MPTIHHLFRRKISPLNRAICLLSMAFVPLAAQAQLEEVVVTATKRSASIQDIPIAISQLGGSELDERGIRNIEQLSYQIPNLQFGAFGSNSFITIRGIGTTVDSGVAEPAVATYIDGVFLPRSTMGVLRQVDMERVEVLRGPQGTLYGRNATGGSINYISRAPAQEFEGGLRLGVENRDGYTVQGFVSGPVSDTVSYRLSAGKEEQDGYVEVINTGEDLVGTDLIYGRAALQIRPSDSVFIDLAIQHEESEGPVSLQQLNTNTVVVDVFAPGNNQTTEVNKTYGDGDYDGDAETTLVSARINWDITDSVSFRSVTGYVDHEVTSTYDADATDALFVDLVDAARPSESWSQEFNVYGTAGDLDWLVGAFYFTEDFGLTLPVEFLSTALGIPGPPFASPVLAGDLEEETESYAFFTDLTYAVTDSLRLNAGLRYNAEEKEFTFFGSPNGDTDETDWLPKLGIQYDVSEDVNLYASWQRGIKSGGHQLSLPTQFEPEELDSYEVGLKSTLMDGQLTANAAFFYYDYADLQATTTIPPTTTLVRNADAEILGGEFELNYAPSESLRFNLGLSLLDSEYNDFSLFDEFTQQVVSLDGDSLIRAPEYTVNLGAQWVIPVNADFLRDVTLRGDLYHSDDYKLTFIDYEDTRQESYTTGNVSVIFTSPSDKVRLRAYVDNVSDEETLNNGSYLATLAAFIGYYSEPRTYGVELLLDF